VSYELNVLQEIRIASPCDASWEEMQGDERSRFCDQCQLHVYNLSAMTAPEAAALVQQKEGRLCVRYYTRPDGTMLTHDCPVGFHAARRRVLSRLAMAAAALVGLFNSRWTGASADASPRKGSPAPPQVLTGSPKPPPRALMGDVGPVTPSTHTMGKIAMPARSGAEMGEVVMTRPVKKPVRKPATVKTKLAHSGKQNKSKGR
jgi:hypothetical protein